MFRKTYLILIPITCMLGCSKNDSVAQKADPAISLPTLAMLREKAHSGQVICLNMIVKNEAEVIRRCLDSVKDVIDTWVIVDTGSTDGTQEIIKAHMKDIPGVLYERPWKNWGETRSEAFNLARGKGDYILFLDADDIIEFKGERKFPELTDDVYFMWRGDEAFSYVKQQLVKGDLPWRWVGVTHEYLDCAHHYTSSLLEEIHYTCISDGATRHDPKKYWKNVDLLLEGLKNEPKNTRYMFYLAESYYDAGEKAKALEWYQKRVDMGGWEHEEIFWSKFRISYILEYLGMADSVVKAGYQDAIDYRPHRGEPYYYLAEFLNRKQEHEAAYEVVENYAQVLKPANKDYLFNADWIQDYGMLFQRSIASYYIGNYQESLDACDQLLANEKLPEYWKKLAKQNRKFPLERLDVTGVTSKQLKVKE